MSEFTKGGWVAELDELADASYEHELGITPEHPSWKVSYAIEDGIAYGFVASLGCHEETEANAHLIAASPEMYEALEDWVKGEGKFSNDDVRQILMKARGEK